MKKFRLELNGEVLLDQEEYLEKGFLVNIISKSLPNSIHVAESDRDNLILLTSSKDENASDRAMTKLKVGDHISLTINMGL